MTGKVIDGSKRFRADDNGPRAPLSETKVDLRSRLKYAATAKEKLRAATRAPELDRPLLARNLGRMAERAFGDDCKARLLSVFELAFGTSIAESHHKKRKRYVRLRDDPSEESGQPIKTGDYVARGNEYLQLALALANHVKEAGDLTEEERCDLCVLRLIEGSSFDDRFALAERIDAEQRAELQRRLDQVIEKVTLRVDLDWMRNWAQRNPLGITGYTGKMGDISLLDSAEGGWGSKLDVTGNINGTLGNPDLFNKIAPCVRLGYVCSPYYPPGAVTFNVSASSRPAEYEPIRAALHAALFGAEAEDTTEEWYVNLCEHENWISPDVLRQARDPDGDPDYRIWLRRALDLELRFDPAAGRWKLCVLLRMDSYSSEFIFSGRPPFATRPNVSFIESEFIASNDKPDPSDHAPQGYPYPSIQHIHALRIREADFTAADGWKDYEYLAINENGMFHLKGIAEPFLGVEGGFFTLPSDDAFQFVFADAFVDDHSIEYAIDDCAGHPTPAHHNSIAGAILRNLAFAAPEKRIDNLLLQDAKARFEKLSELAGTAKREYEAAITKWDAEA